jgi:DNA-binding CsgD family transcriptional regulator
MSNQFVLKQYQSGIPVDDSLTPPHLAYPHQIQTENGSNLLMALLSLSHSKTEHKIYLALYEDTRSNGTTAGRFNIRQIMCLSDLNSYNTARRGLQGLVEKRSVERKASDAQEKQLDSEYIVFRPDEIFSRRISLGLEPYPHAFARQGSQSSFDSAVECLASIHNISRREGQVAWSCAQGLTNAEIGSKLCISEQTVKFHLRHVFIKLGVRRRGELIAKFAQQRV